MTRFDGRNFKTAYIQTVTGLLFSMLSKVYSKTPNQKVEDMENEQLSWEKNMNLLKIVSMDKTATFVETGTIMVETAHFPQGQQERCLDKTPSTKGSNL